MLLKLLKIQSVFFALLGFSIALKAQCGTVITTFPYIEDFESAPAWTSGGANSDWEWGAPSHPTISGAGGGVNCWTVGNLTGSVYNNSEQSWIMSPCFDFTTLDYPWISFKIFWEDEYKFDGMVLQYSTNGGSSWSNLGAYGDAVNCFNDHWYNYNNVTYLTSASPKHGWTGRTDPTSGSCQGSNGSLGWVTAKHCMSALAGLPDVRFRFLFGSGTTCNNFDGIAVDDILIENAPANVADFTYTCAGANTVNFSNSSSPCPTGYLWNFGDGNTSSIQNPSHTYSSSGTYNVTLTSSGPCNAPGSVTIPVSILSITTSTSNISCNSANDGTATANVSGSSGPFTYLWTPGGQSTQTITGLSQGTYSVVITATGSCTVSATATIIQPSTLTASITATPVSCLGDNNGNAIVSVSGGAGPYAYSWSPSGGTNATAANLLAGIYTVTITDSNNCVITANAFIAQPSAGLNVTTTVFATTCGANNGTAIATATGGTVPYSYSWAPAGGNAILATGLSPGTYTITTTDAPGCSFSTTAIITGSVGITSIINSTPIDCNGGLNGTMAVYATGGTSYTYLWNTGQTGQTLTNLNAGTYCVTTTESNGCMDTACFTLPDPPPMNADFISNPTITDINHPEIYFTDQSSGAIIWQWNFGDFSGSTDQNPIHFFYTQGTYQVTLIATNSLGCVDSVSHEIIINDEFLFYAPNAFTPNGDSKNDQFLPKGTGWDPASFQLWIFDRWGNMVFYSNDMNKGWNGKVLNKSKTAQTDVYVWKVQLSSSSGELHNYFGIVTLLKAGI